MAYLCSSHVRINPGCALLHAVGRTSAVFRGATIPDDNMGAVEKEKSVALLALAWGKGRSRQVAGRISLGAKGVARFCW